MKVGDIVANPVTERVGEVVFVDGKHFSYYLVAELDARNKLVAARLRSGITSDWFVTNLVRKIGQ
jgi:hypothetical protein